MIELKLNRVKINKLQTGFVLVAALWLLAILTIAASFFALWTQNVVTIIQSRQNDIQGEIDILSTKANLMYLLSTQRFTIAGLTIPDALPDFIASDNIWDNEPTVLPVGKEIRLDDTVYHGYGNAFFALQDEGGLINLNLANNPVLSRLLEELGIQYKLHAGLIDKLKDYLDRDDLHRINGAEAYHYEKQGLPPPTNRYLYYQTEVQNILDWSKHEVLWQNQQFKQLTHIWLAARPNINTAPELVLRAAYNITAESAKRIIQVRKTSPFHILRNVIELIQEPLDLDPEEFNFFPSHFFRLTLWYKGAKRMQQHYIMLTLLAAKTRPWETQYRMEFKLLPLYSKTTPDYVQTAIFETALFSETQ